MPRPRKPNALRKLEGTERLASFEERESTPADDLSPPSGLIDNPDARRLWNEYATELQTCGVLGAVDKNPLAVLCSLEAVLIGQLRGGDPPNAALMSQWRMLLNEFGLTPSSRSKPAVLSKKSSDPNEEFFGPKLKTG